MTKVSRTDKQFIRNTFTSYGRGQLFPSFEKKGRTMKIERIEPRPTGFRLIKHQKVA